MNLQEIADKLKGRFGDSLELQTVVGDAFIKVSKESLPQVAQFLYRTPELYFDSLMCLSGLDYPDNFTVVYHLFSMKHFHKAVLKVSVPKDNPTVASVSNIWATANWFEREAYDMYGIKFEGHPNLVRILLPDDWSGHPMRKDYQYPKTYQGCPCEI